MRRLSTDTFLNNTDITLDNVIAIRIQNGNFYFLGWLKSNENYNIQLADKTINLQKDIIMLQNLYQAVILSDGYNLPLSTHTLKESNPKLTLLTQIKPYQPENGVTDPNDYEIFEMDDAELSCICDALRDGDYIFVSNK